MPAKASSTLHATLVPLESESTLPPCLDGGDARVMPEIAFLLLLFPTMEVLLPEFCGASESGDTADSLSANTLRTRTAPLGVSTRTPFPAVPVERTGRSTGS